MLIEDNMLVSDAPLGTYAIHMRRLVREARRSCSHQEMAVSLVDITLLEGARSSYSPSQAAVHSALIVILPSDLAYNLSSLMQRDLCGWNH